MNSRDYLRDVVLPALVDDYPDEDYGSYEHAGHLLEKMNTIREGIEQHIASHGIVFEHLGASPLDRGTWLMWTKHRIHSKTEDDFIVPVTSVRNITVEDAVNIRVSTLGDFRRSEFPFRATRQCSNEFGTILVAREPGYDVRNIDPSDPRVHSFWTWDRRPNNGSDNVRMM